MTAAVHPAAQPLKPAVALAIIALLTAALSLLGAVVGWVLSATGYLEDAAWARALFEGDVASTILLVSLLSLVLIGLALAVQLATMILALLVVIRGDGKLRTGAAMLLAMALFGMFFSLSVDLPASASAVTDVLAVLALAVQALRWCVTVAGAVVLCVGIREVRRARAALPSSPRM